MSIQGCGMNLEQDFTWHWHQHLDSCLYMLRNGADSQQQGPNAGAEHQFSSFVAEQFQSPQVQQGYKNCWANNHKEFLEGLAAAAWGVHEPSHYTWPGIHQNLAWQNQNNRNSITNAQREFKKQGGPAPRALGMHFTLEGQRHNPAMVEAYRAAFRDDPARFIADVLSFG